VTLSVSAPATRKDSYLLVVLAALHLVFFVSSLVVMPVLAPGARIPNPFVRDHAAHDLYLAFGMAVRVSSFLQLLSALCLAALGSFWAQWERNGTRSSTAAR
jgi:hypothetical protein